MYAKLARDALFAGFKMADLEPVYGLAFRKGHGPASLKKAIARGIKQGNARVEMELAMIEVQLKAVLKEMK